MTPAATPPEPPLPPPADGTPSKSALRHELRARLSRVTPAELAAASAVACGRIIRSGLLDGVRTIMLYWPMQREVSPQTLAMECYRRKVVVCLPRVGWDDGSMTPAKLVAWGRGLAEPQRGVCEPARIPNQPEVAAESLDVVVAPGLAFDVSGVRLGRGAGFYDRFLERVRPGCVRIGLALEAQIVPVIPRDAHDAVVHVVCTESRWLDLRRGPSAAPAHA